MQGNRASSGLFARLKLRRGQWRLLLFLFAPPALAMIAIRMVVDTKEKLAVLALVWGALVVAESFILLVWGACRADDPWSYFRLWLYGHIGLLWVLTGIVLVGPPDTSPMSAGWHHVIIGFVTVIPLVAAGLAVIGWMIFLSVKKSIDFIEPNYYKPGHKWESDASPVYEEGSLALVPEKDEQGMLTIEEDKEGQLSLELRD